MQSNEQELVRRSKEGDTVAFGLLYDVYIKQIYNFVFYKTYHKETAEDLTSQTFFKALRSIGSVDPEKSFVSWLYRIAQNTVIDHYRSWAKKEATHEDIEDFWDLNDGTDIIGDLDTARDAEKVKGYLKDLSTLERDIIIMRVWQELPYKDISEIVGKSEANSKMIYSRAMKKLRGVIPLGVLLLLLTKI